MKSHCCVPGCPNDAEFVIQDEGDPVQVRNDTRSRFEHNMLPAHRLSVLKQSGAPDSVIAKELQRGVTCEG